MQQRPILSAHLRLQESRPIADQALQILNTWGDALLQVHLTTPPRPGRALGGEFVQDESGPIENRLVLGPRLREENRRQDQRDEAHQTAAYIRRSSGRSAYDSAPRPRRISGNTTSFVASPTEAWDTDAAIRSKANPA